MVPSMEVKVLIEMIVLSSTIGSYASMPVAKSGQTTRVFYGSMRGRYGSSCGLQQQ